MKKILYFVPPVLVCCFYGWVIALQGNLLGFRASILICIALFFISALLMKDGFWWGCAFGMIAMDMEMGVYLEKPIGFIMFLFYLLCGLDLYWNAHKENSAP